MDYYKNKIGAFYLINKMYAEKKHVNEIIMKVSLEFGLSDIVIKKRIKLLNELNGVIEDEGNIKEQEKLNTALKMNNPLYEV